MARWGAIWFALGGVFALISLALPDTSVDEPALLLAVAIASLAAALTLIVVYDRMPLLGFQIAAVGGSLAVSLAVYAWGHASSYGPLPYAWVVLFVFYFFSLPAALVHLGLAMTGYALALAAESPPGSHVDGWLATTGTLLAAGLFVLAMRDRISETIARLADAAHRDALTELPNRRGFQEVFDMELERARRVEVPLSLIVGDLDGFERINDEHGREAGDEALRQVARTIRSGMRGFDVAARIGGEEFAVLAVGSDAHGAYMLAERIRTEIEQLPVGVTASFGIATSPLHGGSLEALLWSADQALYTAKLLGGNRTVIPSAEVSGIVTGPRPPEGVRVELAALLSLAEALDVRDSGSASHCNRVGRLAELTARELGMKPDTVERVRLAGVLHDIGRVGIPDEVMRKSGPLTDEEWRLVREHPEIGARMVETTDFDDDARTWILYHHERPDGRGYPPGHPWDRVPLEARIIGVADAYEAITSDRPYRGALAVDDAAALLRDGAGRQFDAQVVDALLRAI
jgi:diguanylate cyclase (GGDEF)-like protein/putative nucleotidyltransferase with HDIG domain